MYMLKKAIAQKRSEKYLAKQKHLAALKWRQEHPVEKKKKTTPTKEEIEEKKKKILAVRRKIWHAKALLQSRQAKNALHRFNEVKIAAKKLNKKLEQKNLKRSVRSALTHKAIRANAKAAKIPAILLQKPPKKIKAEKKAAAAAKKAEKKGTKAQTKK